MGRSYQGIFVHFTTSGLCNRLRGLAACRALASLLDVPLQMCWTRNWACPANFDSLFQCPPDVERVELPADPPPNWFDVAAHFKPGMTPRKYWRNVQPSGISQRQLHGKSVEKIRGLRLQPRVQRRVDEFVSRYDMKSLIGLHVRRTDLKIMIQCRHVTPPDEPVFQRMDEEIAADPGVRFLMAADNPSSRALYDKRFPGRLVFVPVKFKAARANHEPTLKMRWTSVEDAVVELWLLSKTRRLIGTQWSSFSQYAADLGDIPREKIP